MVKLALCANRSAVRQNNMLREGKPEARPAGLARASLIHTVETLEKARQMFGRNARPKVSDVEFDAIRNRASSENHFFSRRRILQRVLNQVRKDLVDRFSIRIHAGVDRRILNYQFDAIRPRHFAEALERILQQLLHADGLNVESLLARLNPRQRQQVLRKPRHEKRRFLGGVFLKKKNNNIFLLFY